MVTLENFNTNNSEILTITLLGGPGTGKTSIKKSLLGKSFEDDEKITIGAEYTFTDFLLNDHYIKMRICDIAGQQSFESIRRNYMSNSHAAMVVFDLTDISSLQIVLDWIRDYINTNRKSTISNLPVLLVGNKVDLKDSRKIKPEEVTKFLTKENEAQIKSHIIGYIETSAKTGRNIREGFNKLTNSIILHSI